MSIRATTASFLLVALAACQGDAKHSVPAVATPAAKPTPAPASTPTAKPGLAPTPAPASTPAPSRSQIAVGMAYGCVRTAGGTLTCWGRTFPDQPALVAGMNDIAGVVTGQATACAWTAAGAVYCSEGGPAARVANLDDAVEVAIDADAFDRCARRKTGRVACWSEFDKTPVAQDVAGVTGALELAVAGPTACMRDATGVACWHIHAEKLDLHRIPGTADATRISGGKFTFAALRRGKPPIAWHEADYKPQPLPALDPDVTQIALGGDTACALGHAVQCWTLASAGKPYDIANVAGATEIATGYSLGCARIADHVACWGSTGSLGDGTPITTNDPFDVVELTDATRIAVVGEGRTCALRANGHVVCWGEKANAQTDPKPVDTGLKPSMFAAAKPRSWSGSHQRGTWTCTKRAHMKCEMTFHGRHDDDSGTDEETRFGNLDTARDLRMPSNESDMLCVADAKGAVTCFSAWDGADHAKTIDGVTDAIQLAMYGEETCALERAGTVKCWTPDHDAPPRSVARITDAVELVGGTLHACVRHKAGTVSCWGMRSDLGDNFDTHQAAALVVAGVALDQ